MSRSSVLGGRGGLHSWKKWLLSGSNSVLVAVETSLVDIMEKYGRNSLNFVVADNWTYTHTIRCPVIHRESPELKMQVTSRKYEVRCDATVNLFCYLLLEIFFHVDS